MFFFLNLAHKLEVGKSSWSNTFGLQAFGGTYESHFNGNHLIYIFGNESSFCLDLRLCFMRSNFLLGISISKNKCFKSQ